MVFAVASALSTGCAEDSPPKTTPRSSDQSGLVEVAEETGVRFTYSAHAAGDRHMPEVMGAGVAIFDADGDADLDIYLTNGNRLDSAEREPTSINRLYLQQSDGSFVDATAESGLGDSGFGMGVAVGDIDNDGDPDVYVTNYGTDRLYRNQGDGTFVPLPESSHANVDSWSSSATFLDYDRDGYLDLYVVRYVQYNSEQSCYDAAGRLTYCGPSGFPPISDVLLRNRGDGTFTDVSAEAGISSLAGAGLGVVCEDWNGDGWPDIYVANDGDPNHLWINRTDGTFSEEALLMGVALNLHGQAEAGMGVLAGDLDSDGIGDLFVTHLRDETNTLYRGSVNGFSDVTSSSGLGRSSMAFTGFGTAAIDVEHDGDLDLLIANGRVKRGEPLPGTGAPPPWDLLAEPNLFYLNDGSGRFSLADDRLVEWFSPVEVSRGLAVADLDSDGDLDVLVGNIESPVRLYRNDIAKEGSWLKVRAVDPRWKRDAVGARITIVADDLRQTRSVSRGFSYLSSSPPIAHFGLGSASAVDRIEVQWPDGSLEVFPGPFANETVVCSRGSGVPE